MTALERPAEFAGKEFLTDAEAAALCQARTMRAQQSRQPRHQ